MLKWRAAGSPLELSPKWKQRCKSILWMSPHTDTRWHLGWSQTSEGSFPEAAEGVFFQSSKGLWEPESPSFCWLGLASPREKRFFYHTRDTSVTAYLDTFHGLLQAFTSTTSSFFPCYTQIFTPCQKQRTVKAILRPGQQWMSSLHHCWC